MKIWQKILLGFLLVFVLISVSGIPTFLNYAEITDAFRVLRDQELVSMDLTDQMEKILIDMESMTWNYRVTRDESVHRHFRDAKKRWMLLVGQMREVIRNDQTSLVFKRVVRQSLDWMDRVEISLDEIKAGRKADPPSADKVRFLYNVLITQQRAELKDSYDRSVKMVDHAGDLAWLLRAVALVIGLFTCWLVIRSVKKPLDRLVEATNAVAGGRFEPVAVMSEDELGRLTRSFNEMSQSLKERTAALEEQRRIAVQASELKTEFLANTSHELRTPLNTIMGYSRLILDGLARNREEEMKYLETIQQSSKHLLALINDVLDIARIEAGQMKLDLEPVLVKEVFQQVEGHMRLPAQAKGLSLMVSLQEPDLRVHAHPGRLTQVLLNLVGNAIKFTDSGRIEVGAARGGGVNRVVFTVRDTGIGIPQEKQSLLFQKFVQADGSVTRHFGGSGLGLALSKTLLELMHGGIELHSEGEGRGTTVSFTMEREEVET